MADGDYQRAMQILQANPDVPFVRRILDPSNYPTLDLGNGEYATHKMAWGTGDDGQHYVYPTVMMNERGKLQDYGPDQGWALAHSSGNVIPFDSPQDADWFSQNYKSAWGGKPNNSP